jgi:myo-inositol-1-phosphate synthase
MNDDLETNKLYQNLPQKAKNNDLSSPPLPSSSFFTSLTPLPSLLTPPLKHIIQTQQNSQDHVKQKINNNINAKMMANLIKKLGQRKESFQKIIQTQNNQEQANTDDVRELIKKNILNILSVLLLSMKNTL